MEITKFVFLCLILVINLSRADASCTTAVFMNLGPDVSLAFKECVEFMDMTYHAKVYGQLESLYELVDIRLLVEGDQSQIIFCEIREQIFTCGFKIQFNGVYNMSIVIPEVQVKEPLYSVKLTDLAFDVREYTIMTRSYETHNDDEPYGGWDMSLMMWFPMYSRHYLYFEDIRVLHAHGDMQEIEDAIAKRASIIYFDFTQEEYDPVEGRMAFMVEINSDKELHDDATLKVVDQHCAFSNITFIQTRDLLYLSGSQRVTDYWVKQIIWSYLHLDH